MKKIILILFLLYSCSQDQLKSIKVVNNSNYKIFCHETLTYKSDSMCQCYNDFSEKGKKYQKPIEVGIVNKKSKKKIASMNSFSSNIYYSEEKRITISIFYADSIIKYTWDELFGKRKWVKQYKLTVEELDSLNWTIVFDGK